MININMIAERRTRRIREVSTLRFMTLGVLCVLLFAILGNLEKVYECQAAATNKTYIEAKLKKLSDKRTQLAEVKEKIDQQRPVVQLLRTSAGERIGLDDHPRGHQSHYAE